MKRCLKDTLSWATLVALGGSIVAVIKGIADLITAYGSWAAVIEAIGIAGVVKVLAALVGIVLAIVLVAAIIGCLVHCRRFW